MNVISGLILRINRDVIQKKNKIEEGETLRDHLISYTDGKRESSSSIFDADRIPFRQT